MTYDQQILALLMEAGDRGLSVQSVAHHVYNHHLTFFFQPDFDEIKAYVQQYLLKNSKSSHSLIESTGQRGHYRLNTKGSVDARQLLLSFHESKEKQPEPPTQDLSLNLFD